MLLYAVKLTKRLYNTVTTVMFSSLHLVVATLTRMSNSFSDIE